MIFKQWQQVLDGTKTQTRRLVKEAERLAGTAWNYDSPTVLKWFRIKWQVGRTYAVQPRRGEKAVGRLRLTDIRRERLQDATEGDAIAEGTDSVAAFFELWDSIHTKRGTCKVDNPRVWVIMFTCITSHTPKLQRQKCETRGLDNRENGIGYLSQI